MNAQTVTLTNSQLLPFCSQDRAFVSTPLLRADGNVYATNGRVIVSTPATPEHEHVCIISRGYPYVENVMAERAAEILNGGRWLTLEIPPAYAGLPDDEICGECENRQEVEDGCFECDGTRKVRRCCYGRIEGETYLDMLYVRDLLKLPVAQFYVRSSAGQEAVPVRGNGWIGLIMCLRTELPAHFDYVTSEIYEVR